jgi:Predicted phosphatase homologous to the C-terminal domain of histone macroH2A1
MIRFMGEGDLFSSGLQTIACPVNTAGTLGNGLALQFKIRIPGLLEFYQAALRSGDLTVGKLVVYNAGPFQVLLFPTKHHWSKPSKKEYLEAGFKDLVARYKELGITELGIPALGCGYGQLDFVKVFKPLVEECLGGTELPVDVLLF